MCSSVFLLHHLNINPTRRFLEKRLQWFPPISSPGRSEELPADRGRAVRAGHARLPDAQEPDRDVSVGRDDAARDGALAGWLRPVPRHVDRPGLHDRDPDGGGVRSVDRAGVDRDPFQSRSSLDVTLWQDIREAERARPTPSTEIVQEAEPLEVEPGPESYPHLTPGGNRACSSRPTVDRAASLAVRRSFVWS